MRYKHHIKPDPPTRLAQQEPLPPDPPPPPKPRASMSEANRQAAGDRLRAMHAARKAAKMVQQIDQQKITDAATALELAAARETLLTPLLEQQGVTDETSTQPTPESGGVARTPHDPTAVPAGVLEAPVGDSESQCLHTTGSVLQLGPLHPPTGTSPQPSRSFGGPGDPATLAHGPIDPRQDPQSYYDALMRSAPHTYAQYVTKDPTTGKSVWVAAKHLAYIGRKIAQGVQRGNARIMINLGPGMGKSELMSHWAPLWALDYDPTLRVGVFSYDMGMALKFGRDCRDSAKELPLVRITLKEDNESAGYWRTQQGGGMKCASVGSGVIGHRFNIFMVDDPCRDYASAVSAADQKTFREWWQYSLLTRKEPNASIFIMGHRFSVNDPCGWILENDPGVWEVIKFPTLAVSGDILGRAPGESLWPERWPIASFDEMKKKISWQAMYQQDPQSELGDRVYDHFTQDMNVVPNGTHPNIMIRRGPEEIIGLSFDFNINPGMHACVLQADFQRDEVYFDTEFHGERWRTQQVMREFIAWCTAMGHKHGACPWRYVNVYGDRSGRNQSTVTSDTDYHLIMTMLDQAGIPYRMCVPFKNPPVNDRVICVNEALCDLGGTPHLFINKRCKRLLADMNTQPRDENGQPDKTDQSLGHMGDLVGYATVWIRPVRRMQFKPAQTAY